MAPERVALLDAAVGQRCELLAVHGEWSIAAALDRAFNEHPCDVLVSVAPGLVPRADHTPDWLETLVGLATAPGAGVAGALIAGKGIIVRAGWDVPDFREYALEGMRVAAPSSGNDLLIERECTHVSLAAAAVSAAHWRECRDRAHGGFDAAGRGLSSALAHAGARNVWTPYARFDQVVPIKLSRSPSRLKPTRVARGGPPSARRDPLGRARVETLRWLRCRYTLLGNLSGVENRLQ